MTKQRDDRDGDDNDEEHLLDINTTPRYISGDKNIFSTRLETRQSKLSENR